MIKVLIVDDSTFSQSLTTNMLKNASAVEIVGYAGTAREAIKKYRDLKPDVITMDINLPDYDGIECTRRIMSVGRPRILMLSSMGDRKIVDEALAAGAVAFLQKPAKSDELVRLVLKLGQMETDASGGAGELAQAQAFTDAAVAVLSQACEQSVLSSGINKQESALLSEGVAVVLGITGKCHSRMTLDCSIETAVKFGEKAYGRDSSEEECLQALAECANVIAGHGITRLNNDYPHAKLRLAPPAIFTGKGMSMINPRLAQYSVRLSLDCGSFTLSVGLSGDIQ